MSPTRYRLTPLAIALLYTGIAILLFGVSGFVGYQFPPDREARLAFETMRDAAFLVISAILLFLLVRRYRDQLGDSSGKLLASEVRFEELARISPVGIFATDDKGRCTYVNLRWLEISGISEAQAFGGGWASALHAEDRQRVCDAWQQAVETGRPFAEEYRFQNGTRVTWVTGQSIAHRSRSGKIVGYIGTLADITDLKNSEQATRRLATDLETRVADRVMALRRANEDLEAFCYTVTHDLKAPLRAIQGFADIVEADHGVSTSGPVLKHVRHISDASDRMSRLIDDLLKYARLGRQGVSLQPVGLRVVLRQVTDQLAKQITEKNATVTVVGDLPEVVGDPALLKDVFTHLILNGLTYHRPDATPKVSISFALTETDQATIQVQDEGIGIELEHQERIFNVLQRLHSEETFPGSGLGLAVVKKSVEMMGGSVLVRSAPGHGSIFEVRLPRPRLSSA